MPEPMNDNARIVREMVDRFLGWKLPEDFNPDCGISFKREFNEYTAHPMKNEPIGTNLFDAIQARAMLEHVAGPAISELLGAVDSINEILIKHQDLLHDVRAELATAKADLARAREEERERIIGIITDPHNNILWTVPGSSRVQAIHADPRMIRAALAPEQKEG